MWPLLRPAGVSAHGLSKGSRPLRDVGRKGRKRKHRSFRENEPSLSEKTLKLLGNTFPPQGPLSPAASIFSLNCCHVMCTDLDQLYLIRPVVSVLVLQSALFFHTPRSHVTGCHSRATQDTLLKRTQTQLKRRWGGSKWL